MKLFLQIIVVCSVLTVAFGIDATLRKAMQKCQMKTGASASDFAAISKISVLPTTQTQFCLVGCLHKHAEAMDQSNRYVLSKTLALLEPMKSLDERMYNQLSAAVNTCVSKVAPGSDECESAKNMLQCLDQSMKTK